MKHTISVVLPTFNSANTIESCLNSIFTQTRQADEIIVVDNNSSDSTLKILENYRDGIRLYHCLQPGPGPTRNLGVQKANGNLIAFLDSDDKWLPAKLETQEVFHLKYSEKLISGTYSKYVTRSGTYIGTNLKSLNDEEANLQMRRKGSLPCLLPTWMIAREDFLEIGEFDPKYHLSEDFEFAMRALHAGYNFKIIREPLCTNEINLASVTGNHYVKQFLTAEFVRRTYIDCRGDRDLDHFVKINSSVRTSLGRTARKGQLLRNGMGNFSRGKYLVAFGYFFFSLLLSPKLFLKKFIQQRFSLLSARRNS